MSDASSSSDSMGSMLPRLPHYQCQHARVRRDPLILDLLSVILPSELWTGGNCRYQAVALLSSYALRFLSTTKLSSTSARALAKNLSVLEAMCGSFDRKKETTATKDKTYAIKSRNFLCPTSLLPRLCQQKCTRCHFFTLCPDPPGPIISPDPPILCPAVYVHTCSSVDLGQLKHTGSEGDRLFDYN